MKDTSLVEIYDWYKQAQKHFDEGIKHRLFMDNNIPAGVEYTLNFNIEIDNKIWFINASFAEEGTTGLRESICSSIYAKENDLNVEDVITAWSKDPYYDDMNNLK